MKKYLCASLVLVLAVVLTACGGGNNRSGGSVSGGTETGSSKQYAELRWGFMFWPGPIDNNKDAWFSSISIQQLVVQSLMELEADGKVTPGLASSVEQPTPTTYVYNLKHGVRFSDGKPLTPADVVYSLEAQHPRQGSLDDWVLGRRGVDLGAGTIRGGHQAEAP